MLWQIMTDPRSKSELLSKTCISYLEDWVKENHFWRRKILKTNAIQKGIECESEAVFILNKALWTNYKKAVYAKWEKMDNGRCTGHEDIDWGDHTIDTKVCESFDTFPIFDEEADKNYWWQWQAYMRLKWENHKKHTVAKVLVNSPKRIIEQKLYNAYNNLVKKYEDNMQYIEEEYEQEAKEIFLQHVFDKQITINSNWVLLQLTDEEVIPYEKRIHLVEVERDNEAIARIAKRVEECRLYLSNKWY